jgi:hypothetical protein
MNAELAKGPSIAEIYTIAFADSPRDDDDVDKYTINEKIVILEDYKEELKKYEPRTRSEEDSKVDRIKLIDQLLNRFLDEIRVIDDTEPLSQEL